MKTAELIKLSKSDRALLVACTGRPTTPENAHTLLACRSLVGRKLMASERECVRVDGDDTAFFVETFWTHARGLAALEAAGGAS